MGIEPTRSAWKAEVPTIELHPRPTGTPAMPRQRIGGGEITPACGVLPSGRRAISALFSARSVKPSRFSSSATNLENQFGLVEGGFEPPKAEPADLQSDPFGHSGTPPRSPVLCFRRF